MPSVSISTTSPAERRSAPAGRHPRAPHQVAGAGVGAVGAAPAGGGGEHPSPSALDRGRLAGAGRGRHRRGLGGGRARAGGVIYRWLAATQSWTSFRPGAPPILSAFDTFATGGSCWIAVAEEVEWVVGVDGG